MGEKIIVIGHGGHASKIKKALSEQGNDIEIITEEEAKQRGLTITKNVFRAEAISFIEPRQKLQETELKHKSKYHK